MNFHLYLILVILQLDLCYWLFWICKLQLTKGIITALSTTALYGIRKADIVDELVRRPLYLVLLLQLDLCYCLFCTFKLELTKGIIISLSTMATYHIHGADIVNELLQTMQENFTNFLIDCRSRDTCKTGRFARLRYWLCQLLKPPDVPCTPFPGLTLRLYQFYGHPYSQLMSALEGHAVCWIVAVS